MKDHCLIVPVVTNLKCRSWSLNIILQEEYCTDQQVRNLQKALSEEWGLKCACTRTLSHGYFMLQYFVVIRQRYEKYFLNTDLSWM